MSQWELVLAYIKARGSITALDAVIDLGIIDLAGRIRDLRKKVSTFFPHQSAE